MDSEDEMMNLCLISQAHHVESLIRRIEALENDLKNERSKSVASYANGISSESYNDLLKEVENYKVLQKALNEENNRLEAELTATKQKCEELKTKMEEDQHGYGDIQSQSVGQIRELGEENKRLKDEVSRLKSELLILKSDNQRSSDDSAEVSRLKKENEELRIELSNYKSTENVSLHGFLGPLNIDAMSESELRMQLRSEHIQLETATEYIRDIEEMIDQQLNETLPQDQLPSPQTPTHEKLNLLVDTLRSGDANAGLISELRQTADNNYQCAEEWQAEAHRVQDELKESNEANHYLLSCVQRYLYRLVGSDFSNQIDARGYLESQFELACKRSEKLLGEYMRVRKELDLYRTSGAPLNGVSLDRIKLLIQRIAEKLNLTRGGDGSSWPVLELYLQDVFAFVDEVVPKTRETIVRKDNEIKQLRRELRRVRPFEASGRL